MNKIKLAMDAIKLAKKDLRKEMQEIVDKIGMEERTRQSETVYQKLVSMPEYRSSTRVSLYLSTNTEINTISILKHIFENGKQAFVPTYAGKTMKMVKLNSMDDYTNLPLTKWNIKQPAPDELREDALETGGLDLIILPGVAFTNSGKRLGHGMGYYDKYLRKCIESQKKKPHLVAVAFNEQIRKDIPTAEHDVTLDLIITDISTQ